MHDKYTHDLRVKATGGGGVSDCPRSKYMFFDMFCISRNRAGCKKPHQKNSIPSGSCEFF